MFVETWSYELRLQGGSLSLPLPVAIHPHNNGRVVVNVPGYNGHIDGYSDKYVKMANFVVSQGIGAVLRCSNCSKPAESFAMSCQNQLRQLLSQARTHSERICGSVTPSFLLMGFSAGASAIAAVAASCPRVEAILLMAPSADAGYEAVEKGMKAYQGPAYIVVGAEDTVVGSFPTAVAEWGPDGAPRECVVIPGCDHQFRGTTNGIYLSQAPLWAFGNLTPYPHPTAGTPLY